MAEVSKVELVMPVLWPSRCLPCPWQWHRKSLFESKVCPPHLFTLVLPQQTRVILSVLWNAEFVPAIRFLPWLLPLPGMFLLLISHGGLFLFIVISTRFHALTEAVPVYHIGNWPCSRYSLSHNYAFLSIYHLPLYHHLKFSDLLSMYCLCLHACWTNDFF